MIKNIEFVRKWAQLAIQGIASGVGYMGFRHWPAYV